MATGQVQENPGIRGLLEEARVLPEFLEFASDGLAHCCEKAARRGKVVLLVPGFLAGDMSLIPLAERLRLEGHRIYFSRIFLNVRCPGKTIEHLAGVLKSAVRETGSRVVLIGHSLGGIYVRELARRFPWLIERIFLLGAPIRKPYANSSSFLRPVVLMASFMGVLSCGGRCGRCGAFILNPSPGAPSVPETLIYSRTDGVVQWQSCVETGSNVEAVEVNSSHLGLPVSLEALKVISDRLNRAEPALN